MEATIGIDLGTRYAQVAVDLPRSGVQIIPSRWGGMRSPSFVAFAPEGLVAGEEAVQVSFVDPSSVWWDMKRHLGTDWVARRGGRTYTPEELLLPLLSLLREDAEVFLRTFVHSCVLAVPAHFSFSERGALARAARQVGFERVRIVNEPTAAALSIGTQGRFLIIDFGGGTLDLSVVEGDGGVFQVLDSSGRKDIGGLDLDKILAEWMCQRTGIPLTRPGDPRSAVIMREAEGVKISLSTAHTVTWRPPAGLAEGARAVDVSRQEFERLIGPTIEEIAQMVERMWSRYRPDRLILVGGSGRIPLLRRVLAERVREPERLRSTPEDAVVTGCALYANQGKERLLIDVLSRTLGVQGGDGGVVPILYQGTPLPAEATRRFTACGNGNIHITIVQGEGPVRSLARVLQTVDVDSVRNGEAVDIHFRVDGGGLLQVEVKRAKNTNRQTISLECDGVADEASCNLPAELLLREQRIARLAMGFPDNFQQRLRLLMGEVRTLRNEEPSLQWRALETIDRMIAEMDRAVAP